MSFGGNGISFEQTLDLTKKYLKKQYKKGTSSKKIVEQTNVMPYEMMGYSKKDAKRIVSFISMIKRNSTVYQEIYLDIRSGFGLNSNHDIAEIWVPTLIKYCACCGIHQTKEKKHKLCSGCNLVSYCSTECQKKHWHQKGNRSHRVFCKSCWNK